MQTGKILDLNTRQSDCERCAAGAECLVQAVDGEERPSKPPRVLHPGTPLFRMGERFQSLYVIRSGSVKCYLLSEEGEEQILGFYAPGELIGFDAIASGRHACTAVALETSSVCALPFETLTRLADRTPGLYQQLMRSMSRETLRLAESLVLARRPAEQRVAVFLLELADRQAKRGFSRTTLMLPMSRTDVGKYLGLTVETVSRVLTRFQEQGVLSKDRTRVELHDHAALRALAGGAAEMPSLRRAG